MLGTSRTSTLFKGVALGATVAVVTLVGSAAMAGTGIGSVFNLGASNRVNARSQLEGSTPSAVLNVSNGSHAASASGISIDVPSDRPPLVVNSSTKVKNLDADLLDGRGASSFQAVTSKQCSRGTAIDAITPSGSASCGTSAVLAVDEHQPPNQTTDQKTYPPSSLGFAFLCGVGEAQLTIQNLGLTPATLDSLYAPSGASSESRSEDIVAGGTTGFTAGLAGAVAMAQFVYFDQTTVTTVLLSVVPRGPDGCDYRGTVQIAPRA